jgi:hypothetical protein
MSADRGLRGEAADGAGISDHGIGKEFPLLYEMAQQYDFAERLGGCSSPLLAEADAALREIWNARNAMEASRG